MRGFTAVVNPSAGGSWGGRAAARRLLPVVRRLREADAPVAVEYSRSLEHAAELATAAAQRGDVVLAVGGDGTVGRIAGAVARADGTLGIVPAGRGNDFARQLDLPSAPGPLADLLREAEPQKVDVLETGGAIVAGSVYAGIDSVANVHFNRARFLGGASYHYAATRALLTWRPVSYRITVDGAEHRARGYAVVVANSGFYGNGRHAAPAARVDDGLLDVVFLKHAPRRVFISIAMKELYTGSHVNRPQIQIIRGHEVRIEADRELPFGGDGELLGTLPTTARILPGALRVLAA